MISWTDTKRDITTIHTQARGESTRFSLTAFMSEKNWEEFFFPLDTRSYQPHTWMIHHKIIQLTAYKHSSEILIQDH